MHPIDAYSVEYEFFWISDRTQPEVCAYTVML